MTPAFVLKDKDIKEMISEKYGVDVKNIKRMQYSFVVIRDDEEEEEDEDAVE